MRNLPPIGPALVLLFLLASEVPAAEKPLPPFHAGRIDAEPIQESSGLVESRAHPGIFWTHNDSGGKPELFAIDATGKLRQSYTVKARNIDWEDIAIDDQRRLYVADIGNNGRKRQEVYVHAIAEPDPAVPAKDALQVTASWTLRYPGNQPFDAESLVIVGKEGYLIDKQLNFGRATLYAFDIDPARPRQTLVAVGALQIRLPATAADVSADGRWLAVLTVGGPCLFEINGDIARATNGSDPKQVRFASPKMEACAITKDGVLTTTEDRQMYRFRWKDFGLE